ncbi:hypothetical protein TWF730_002795 [Orbilia blumenaviensis]|uniref:rRNA methyltransferase 1, mitochondrial n=1 Tax=Orbilia blumenaviensis TaxID=1796055 RepID=A0AAV9UAM2_9PEZI
MYRGIAHAGLSRIPTSRHVPIRCVKGCYSCRELSSTVVLGHQNQNAPWMLRGNRASRYQAKLKKESFMEMVKDKELRARYGEGLRDNSHTASWESIPPPPANRSGSVAFRTEPLTEETGLTGSGALFTWDRSRESSTSTKPAVEPPASAVLNRQKYDPREIVREKRRGQEDQEFKTTSRDQTPFDRSPPITRIPTIPSEYGVPWPSEQKEVHWGGPRIRVHESENPAAFSVDNLGPNFKKKKEPFTKPPNFYRVAVAQKNSDDYDVSSQKWLSHSYSPLDGELESSEIGRSRYGGYDGREEITVLKKPPRELPYSSPTSEFLYGHNICKLALKEKKRKIHKLHIYTGLMRQSGTIEKERVLRDLARESKIPVLATQDVGLLDAMSKGRPHNGFALEVEAMDIPMVSHLVKPHKQGTFNAPFHQSTSYAEIKTKREGRQPFVLVLDQVLDGGNFGAILRSAYFLGVDAVFINAKNSTPPTAVTSRASAGALEAIDFYDIGSLHSFIELSQKQGWKFYGAMPTPSQRDLKISLTKKATKWYDMEGLGDPTSRHPVALVMGNEADGLRPTIQKLLDSYVTIRKGEDVDVVVDSLNVGVAASILAHAFLNPAVKGGASVPAMNKRSTRRLAARDAVVENMLFQVDDGKYEAPRYNGLKEVKEWGEEDEGLGDPRTENALFNVSQAAMDLGDGGGDEVEDGDEDGGIVDGEDEDSEVSDEEDEDPEFVDEDFEEEEDSGIEDDEDIESDGEEESDEETAEPPTPRSADKDINAAAKPRQDMGVRFDSLIASKRVPKPPTDEEIEANNEAAMEELNEELDWEEVQEMAEEGIEEQEVRELQEEKKQKATRKSREWDAIKPEEPDFAAGLVGPFIVSETGPKVAAVATSPPSPDAIEEQELDEGKKKKSKRKKKITPNPLPKKLQEMADHLGLVFTKNATVKQKKMLKKARKKMQLESRKKVREDASEVRRDLGKQVDPMLLKGSKGRRKRDGMEVQRMVDREKIAATPDVETVPLESKE